MRARIASRVRKYGEVFSLIRRHAAGHFGLLSLFVLLAVFGTLTESVGVFLLIPLLQTMGKENVFANVPLLGWLSRIFDVLPVDKRLLWAGGLMLIIVLLRGMVQFAQEFVGYVIPHRVDFALRLRAYSIFVRTSMRFADEVGAGEVSNLTTNQPARIGIALRFVATLVANVAVLLSYILVLTLVSPILLVTAVVYVALASLLFRVLTTNLVHSVGHDVSEANVRFGQILYETINGGKLIRLAGATPEVLRGLEKSLLQLGRARDKVVAVENMTIPFFSTVGGLLICAIVMLIGTLRAESAAQEIGVVVIFFVLLLRILSPLSIINISRNNIIIHLDAFRNFDAFLARAEQEREIDGYAQIENFAKEIRFDCVSFAYGKGQQGNALDQVSFVVPKGQLVAIVGPSGAGKTTIVNLITRLYRPDSGSVKVDGNDLNSLAIESWRRLLGVVTQETLVTSDTIKANLCFGLRREVSGQELQAAARLAAIDDWIDSLPEGYNTCMGDRGTRLSGGQRQRIALARAFLRAPEVLLLDEATSALDTLTEQTIQKQLQNLSKERKTIIVIAHRLSTVKRADSIVVLENGRVAETGNHHALLELKGLYSKMIESQSFEHDEAE